MVDEKGFEMRISAVRWQMLLDPHMKFSLLREMMAAEVSSPGLLDKAQAMFDKLAEPEASPLVLTVGDR